MRAGEKRRERREVYIYHSVIYRIAVARERRIVRFSALGAQKIVRYLVGGENRGGGAQFRSHIRYRRPLGNGKRLYSLAAPFDYIAYAALYGKYAEKLKTYILGTHPWAKLSREIYLHHLRHGDAVSAAAHGNGNIKSARTESEHADTAARRRMAVRADEGLARCAEALEMYLMADTVAGT